MAHQEYVDLDVDEIKKETAKAFLVRLDTDEFWIPKSLIENANTLSETENRTTISIAEWFAEKEDLI